MSGPSWEPNWEAMRSARERWSAATPHSAASVFSFSGLAMAGRVAQGLHHLAPVVAVRRGAAGHRPSQVAGHDQVGIGAAGSHLRPFAERIDAARPHVTDIAAQAQVSESAERLHVVVAVPHGFRADILRVHQHFLRGGSTERSRNSFTLQGSSKQS